MIDVRDEMILKLVRQNASIQEMCKVTGLSSTSTVKNRLDNLEKLGLINGPPRPRMARSRRLSQEGENYLLRNGLIG